MTLELIYNAANIFVLPFWALMILLPKWSVTQKIMASYIPFVALALTYLYLFVTGLDPEIAEGFTSAQLSDIARLFSYESVAATGWVHFLVMDLFVGRWIYLEGQRTGVWTLHSLALCLFAGPLGLLSHILTAFVSQRFFAKNTASASSDASPAQS